LSRDRGKFVQHFFYVSSRRWHTILVSDWSSDVCSSDLEGSLSNICFKLLKANVGQTALYDCHHPDPTAIGRSLLRQKDHRSYRQIGRASCRKIAQIQARVGL